MQGNSVFPHHLLTPKFYEHVGSPLSTKKERLRCTPSQRYRSVPRLARTAPVSRMYSRFALQPPHFISFKSHSDSVLARSRSYDPSSSASYFEQCFIVDKKLGEGSFGEVFRVQSRDDHRWYAVKRSIEVFRNDADRQLKLREVQKHELLPANANLVAFIAAWEDRGRLYIQYELCEYSLSEYAEREHNISEPLLWNYFTDLLMAVNHLHDHDLLHLDIKPANVFITKDGIAKLGDFGLIFDLKKDHLSTAQEGDSKYLAPEVLNEHVSKASDIFSLGVTILELATDLDVPSGGEGWHMLRAGRVPNELVKDLSENLRRLIRWMMDPRPERRPTAQQLRDDFAVRNHIASRRRSLALHSVLCYCLDRLGDLWHLLLWLLLLLIGPFAAGWRRCVHVGTRRKHVTPCTTPFRNQTATFDLYSAERQRTPDTASMRHRLMAGHRLFYENSDEEEYASGDPHEDEIVRCSRSADAIGLELHDLLDLPDGQIPGNHDDLRCRLNFDDDTQTSADSPRSSASSRRSSRSPAVKEMEILTTQRTPANAREKGVRKGSTAVQVSTPPKTTPPSRQRRRCVADDRDVVELREQIANVTRQRSSASQRGNAGSAQRKVRRVSGDTPSPPSFSPTCTPDPWTCSSSRARAFPDDIDMDQDDRLASTPALSAGRLRSKRGELSRVSRLDFSIAESPRIASSPCAGGGEQGKARRSPLVNRQVCDHGSSADES